MKCWNCRCENATEHVNVCIPHKKLEPGQSWMVYGDPIPATMLRCYCKKCWDEKNRREKAELKEYIRIKKERMFERAMCLLEHQMFNFEDYKESIDVVEEFMRNNPDKFDSSDEVIAAIILVHNRVHSKMQFKVDKYQIDFLLDEKKVVLEIDGDTHDTKRGQWHQAERDMKIKEILGKDWEIVHIKAELLESKAEMLIKAIDEVIDYRNFGKVIK